MSTRDNIKVGKPDTDMDKPSHTRGIREGNRPGSFAQEPGHYDAGETGAGRPMGKATARRSTSISPDSKNPIDPRSPNLPPA